MKPSNRKWLYAIIGIASFLVYSNTLKHEFVLDDDVVYLKNSFVQSGLEGIPEILSHGFLYGFNRKNDQSYRPLVLINFAVFKSILGNQPDKLHLMNVLYYCVACMLLYYLLNLWFKDCSFWFPFFMALIFSLHPIHTEVVANIKGLDELLHFIMAILSLIGFALYIDKGKIKYLWYACLFFALALLSKEIALSLLFIAPLSIWTFRKVEIKELIKVTLPLVSIVGLYFLVRSIILDTITFEEDMKVINNGLAAADTYADQLATTFFIFSEYIKLLFVPHPLSWDYSYPHFQIVSFTHWRVLLTIALLSLTGFFALKGLKKRSVFSYCFFLFCAAFALTSNFFILIGSTLGERFLFFPSVAFAVFLPLVIFELTTFFKLKGKSKLSLQSTVILLVCILFAYKTYSRNKDWRNNETLFQSGIKATPNNSRAQAAIASSYRVKGEKSKQFDQKQEYFRKAIDAYKFSVKLLPTNSSAWYNLGVTYMNMGNDSKAKSAFLEAIQVDSQQINAFNNLGVIYFREKQYDQAEKYFQECLRININFQSAYANLGAVYHNQGKLQKAERYYKEALRLNPSDLSTQNNYRQLQQ